MSFSKSDVVLVPIPFTDLTSRKVRPAIIIGHSTHVGDLFVVPISSQMQNVDVPLQDWRVAGLNVLCGVKAQIATIEERLVSSLSEPSLRAIVYRLMHNFAFGCSFRMRRKLSRPPACPAQISLFVGRMWTS
jgi:mRNA interferase MazF